jgi:DNA-binding NtrC family response regulator
MPSVVPALSQAEPYVVPRHLSLLIADEESWARDLCKEVAGKLGFFSVFTADSAGAALQMVGSRQMDVVLLDVELQGPDGLDLVQEIKQQNPRAEVVMVSRTTGDSAPRVTKNGVDDYLRKPFNVEELRLLLTRVVSLLGNSLGDRMLTERSQDELVSGGPLGRSPEMQKLYRIIAKVASSRHPVLIQGESGTGKEMVARAIHADGPFRDRPFVLVDCASPNPGLVESELFGYVKGTLASTSRPGVLSMASGGTIFLDEIGEMPLDLQAKLMRALQEREVYPPGSAKPIPVDARVIAATNHDLDLAIQQGTFRRDLFFRLNVVGLRLPPLRERKEDIRLLVDHFLERISGSKDVRHTVSPEAMRLLVLYDWPGNVRELENCLERAAAMSSSPVLNASDLPAHVRASGTLRVTTGGKQGRIVPLAEVEKQTILDALEQLNGDKLMTAKLLGIGKTTLYRKLKEYGVREQWVAAQVAGE